MLEMIEVALLIAIGLLVSFLSMEGMQNGTLSDVVELTGTFPGC